jgi:hypothetical protein
MAPGTTPLCRAAGAFAVASAIALAGCGGDDEPSPTEAAGAAAGDFVAAIESGDYEAACGALTEELVSQLGGEACSEQIGSIAGEGGVEIEVTDVRVSGPKAVAETAVSREGEGTQESSFDLLKSGDEWKVSGLGD